ncbi:MAG: hypothetical protein BIFFINMI_02821 [Phycisphaerae bacterium]|nr:hypothetical protein [Phycisphaerae bacterium]
MKSHDNFSVRNILPAMQAHTRGRTTHSHAYPGHEERMVAHKARIHGHPCQCGSGLAYGACCINRLTQEYLELAHRAKEAARADV